MVPESGSWSVAMVRMRELFPAPLGPRRPNIPLPTVRDTFLSARTPLGYVFERSVIVRATVHRSESKGPTAVWCGEGTSDIVDAVAQPRVASLLARGRASRSWEGFLAHRKASSLMGTRIRRIERILRIARLRRRGTTRPHRCGLKDNRSCCC